VGSIEVRFGELSVDIRVSFDELRRVRATTESVVLSSAAARNLILAVKDAGLDQEEGAMLAFRAIALGNKDAGRSR
jgi:hypothetical protein